MTFRLGRGGRLWILGAALLLALGVAAMSLGQREAPCAPRADDPDQYLLRICHYIRSEQLDVAPADPAAYRILRTEERDEGGRAVVRIFLSCCYLGDVAEIDKASGQVIAFYPGAK